MARAPITGRPTRIHHHVVPFTTTDHLIRCQGVVTIHSQTRPCNKLLAMYAGRPWRIECPRCKHINLSPGSPDLAPQAPRDPAR